MNPTNSSIETSRRRLPGALAGLGLLSIGLLGLGLATSAPAQTSFIVVASTTSTEQSGLFGHLLPAFTRDTGIEVRVVAQGTGQALETGKRGDADVLFVHDTPSELAFVSGGFGVERREVMYNDFVVVGPKADPAGVRGMADTRAAFTKIAAAKAPFASRGDDSGTHKSELRLWTEAKIDVKTTGAGWYRETGSGMGPTLNTAAASEAYALTDRGTWLNFKNRQTLEILVAGDPVLFNQYGVMLVNPERHKHVKAELGRRFIAWLISAAGQNTINDYKINGEPLFFANARPAGS